MWINVWDRSVYKVDVGLGLIWNIFKVKVNVYKVFMVINEYLMMSFVFFEEFGKEY